MFGRVAFVAAASVLILAGACKKDAPPAEPKPSTAADSGSRSAPGTNDADAPAPETVPGHLAAAVAHPDRPPKDRERDADRSPGKVLEFAGVAPGMTVIDLMAGTGYYSELVAHAVGPEGKVLVQNSPWVLERFAEKPLAERLAKGSLRHAKRLDVELDKMQLAPGSVDVALMVLFYHDTYWMKVDRPAMNQRIFEGLKPGGVYIVIDHHAAAGAGDSVVQSLHRGDAEQIKGEVLAAGFELEAESDLLRRPEDDRTRNVFDPELRGKTDRFIFKFRRPAEPAAEGPNDAGEK